MTDPTAPPPAIQPEPERASAGWLARWRRSRSWNWVPVAVVAAVIAVAQDSSVAAVTPGPVPDLTAAAHPTGSPPWPGRFLATTVYARQLTWAGAAACAVRSSCTALPVDTSSAGAGAARDQMSSAHTTAAQVAAGIAGIHARRPAPTIALGDVNGPSAGLMLTLADLDAMTDGDLTAGLRVAGTGTISSSGAVGPVGGITVKVVGAARAGADLFLAPDSLAGPAQAAQPGLRVVPVTDVADAVRVLCSLGATDTVCADQ